MLIVIKKDTMLCLLQHKENIKRIMFVCSSELTLHHAIQTADAIAKVVGDDKRRPLRPKYGSSLQKIFSFLPLG
jgi:hypothetical protein